MKVLLSSNEFLFVKLTLMSAQKSPPPVTRRDALCRIGNGFGMLAFAGLRVADDGCAAGGADVGGRRRVGRAASSGARQARHLPVHERRAVAGGQLRSRSRCSTSTTASRCPAAAIATERKTGALMRSPFTFKKYGKSGIEVSELFPHVGECADDICFIRSMYTDIPNHEPSMLMMNTGHTQVGRPSMGSWLTYGLGTDNQNLPGFVVLCPDVPTTVGPPLWNNAFLPAMHQGTFIADKVEKQDRDRRQGLRSEEAGLLHPQRQVHADRAAARARSARDSSNKLQLRARAVDDPQLEAAIQSMEVAYRMQTEAPDVFDIRKESEATLEAVRPGQHRARLPDGGAAGRDAACAWCRSTTRKGDPWDAHADIQAHRKNAKDSDQPFAAVIKDLKSRGLFKDTLVVCGSEFGRTPVVEVGGGAGGRRTGRDHNPFGFTMWLAGGGIKGGTIYGATDDFGFKAVEKPVHVHDLHATILHLMGIDHTKLTYRYSGRDFRLTDVAGTVVREILA